MTFDECIEWLTGTARNMDTIVADDPDGDVVFEAYEVREVANRLRDVAASLMAHFEARQLEPERLDKELTSEELQTINTRLKGEFVALDSLADHSPGDGRQP